MDKNRELLHLMNSDGIESCTISFGLNNMSEKARKDLLNECGKINFYERVTCLYLMSCNQDGIIAEEELANIKTSIGYIFNRSGIDVDIDQTISRSRKFIKTADSILLDGTISVFKKYLSKETLKGIINDCYYMCEADGMAEEESAFIIKLYKTFIG